MFILLLRPSIESSIFHNPVIFMIFPIKIVYQVPNKDSDEYLENVVKDSATHTRSISIFLSFSVGLKSPHRLLTIHILLSAWSISTFL